MEELGFNSEEYLKIQSDKIREKMNLFDNKLYMEFGGKLFDDYHASRVLPGFEPDIKIRLLQELKQELEVILCINASDIEKSKMRADYGITYDMELLRLISNFNKLDIEVNSVVITLYNGQPKVDKFRKVLEKKGIKTYIHTYTKGYPTDIDVIVSDEGYGRNEFIETTKKLVVVTAPGANSGKLATCLSQLYHEYKLGNKAGYAKYETFPVWNLPLRHPINMAYEAATADLGDINMIDSFHLEEYGISAVNYNRDLATFPILKNILHKITGTDIYKSPTDMGVNAIKTSIISDEVVKQACYQEIIRRYYVALADAKLQGTDTIVADRIKMLMNELDIFESDRSVIGAALDKYNLEEKHVMSLKLNNGKIITGKQSELLSPVSAVVINAIKELTNINDDVFLLSPNILEPIQELKQKTLYSNSKNLSLQEVLIALSICGATNPIIHKALNNLDLLKGCEAHSTYIITDGELNILKSLRINLTCEPNFI